MSVQRFAHTRAIGAHTETIACTYLQQHGLTLLARNVQSRFGEIDLVMHDGQCVVFIEVRYRKQNQFGGALASVTCHKQQRLFKTAVSYLQTQPHLQAIPIRFDVVTLEGNNSTVTNWVKNAFWIEEPSW